MPVYVCTLTLEIKASLSPTKEDQHNGQGADVAMQLTFAFPADLPRFEETDLRGDRWLHSGD